MTIFGAGAGVPVRPSLPPIGTHPDRKRVHGWGHLSPGGLRECVARIQDTSLQTVQGTPGGHRLDPVW